MNGVSEKAEAYPDTCERNRGSRARHTPIASRFTDPEERARGRKGSPAATAAGSSATSDGWRCVRYAANCALELSRESSISLAFARRDAREATPEQLCARAPRRRTYRWHTPIPWEGTGRRRLGHSATRFIPYAADV